MDKKMRSIGIKMSLLMGLTMSLFLSLVGTVHGLSSSPAEVPFMGYVMSYLKGFAVSLIISLVIGFIVPMGRISRAIGEKAGHGTLKARILDSFVSNLIYTPIITVVMVALNYGNAASQAEAHGQAAPPFIMMFLSSLWICFLVGWVIIFIVQPLYMKLLMKGIPAGGPGMGGPERRGPGGRGPEGQA
ncbi:MAG: hypothetical protein K6B72_09785 [Lachnospiraceae bacterium]|nr:hypothetical protein [Lachnospiraceae bacterium]